MIRRAPGLPNRAPCEEINAGAPGRRLVGRVVTAVFMPARPDMRTLLRGD